MQFYLFFFFRKMGISLSDNPENCGTTRTQARWTPLPHWKLVTRQRLPLMTTDIKEPCVLGALQFGGLPSPVLLMESPKFRSQQAWVQDWDRGVYWWWATHGNCQPRFLHLSMGTRPRTSQKWRGDQTDTAYAGSQDHAACGPVWHSNHSGN